MNLHQLTIKANFSGSFSSKIAGNNKRLVNRWTLTFFFLLHVTFDIYLYNPHGFVETGYDSEESVGHTFV